MTGRCDKPVGPELATRGLLAANWEGSHKQRLYIAIESKRSTQAGRVILGSDESRA
jgi:hypothetical protein